MVIVNEERAKRDEVELFLYGICSTQLYVDYRECIDKKLKFLMVELAKHYEKEGKIDKEHVNEMLFEQYKAFWAEAEPTLQKFYEDIQEILAPPPNCLSEEISPINTFCAPQIEELETQISELQDKYEAETYFLHELKHRQIVVETICKPIKEWVDIALKTQEVGWKHFKYSEELDNKRGEMTGKSMGNIDKSTLVNFIASDIKHQHSPEDTLKKCLDYLDLEKQDV